MSQDKQCAYCHAKLFDDDDVVYCPECGAPHHRDCYNKLGHCAREQYHGLPEEDIPKSEVDQSRPDGIPRDREGHICSKCGSLSSSDTLFCPYCGTAFNEAKENPTDRIRPPYIVPGVDPYGGVDPATEIDGVSTSELATYVRIKSDHYIPVFNKLDKGNRKIGWNWSAFIFSYGWMFYRKCYFAGFVSILFTIVSYVLMAPYFITIMQSMTQNGFDGTSYLTQSQYTAIIEDAMAHMEPFTMLTLLAGVALLVAVHVIVAMFANRIYMNQAKSKIQKIKSDDRIDDKISAIASVGGANIFSAAIILYTMINVIFNNIIYLFY